MDPLQGAWKQKVDPSHSRVEMGGGFMAELRRAVDARLMWCTLTNEGLLTGRGPQRHGFITRAVNEG